MILEATLTRSGRWWAIEIPALEAFSQARTRSEALLMAASAVDDLAGRPLVYYFRKSSRGATISEVVDQMLTLRAPPALGTTAQFEADRILVRSDDTAGLVALVLRHKRSRAGLTLQEMAKRLGSTSPNTYARYEQGRAMPSVAILDRLLQAVDGKGLVLG